MENLYKMNYKLWLILLLLLLACGSKKKQTIEQPPAEQFNRYEELEDLPEAGEGTKEDE
jgi:hypothetical protein